jgi:hypothetical protein
MTVSESGTIMGRLTPQNEEHPNIVFVRTVALSPCFLGFDLKQVYENMLMGQTNPNKIAIFSHVSI